MRKYGVGKLRSILVDQFAWEYLPGDQPWSQEVLRGWSERTDDTVANFEIKTALCALSIHFAAPARLV